MDNFSDEKQPIDNITPFSIFSLFFNDSLSFFSFECLLFWLSACFLHLFKTNSQVESVISFPFIISSFFILFPHSLDKICVGINPNSTCLNIDSLFSTFSIFIVSW